MEPLAYSVAATAAASGISASSIKRLIREGRLPIRKIGRRTIILRDDLEALLRSLPSSRPALSRGERGRFT